MYVSEYESKIKGDCADDIEQSTINNEIVKKFLNWAKVLEDTITHLRQAIIYYKDFSFIRINEKATKNFPSFLTNFRYSLCISITMLIGKLYSDENDLSLFKFNIFCRDNKDILFTTDYDFVKSQKMISRQYILYMQQIKDPRDKIYGHSGEMLLDSLLTQNTVGSVSTTDLMKYVDDGITYLSYIWKLYNGHDMCFRLEKHDDYKDIIDFMIDFNQN